MVFALTAVPAAADQNTGASGLGGALTSAASSVPVAGTPDTASSTDSTPPASSTTPSTTALPPAPVTTTTTTKRHSRLASHGFGSRLLTLGMRGTDVRDLQHDLSALGFGVSASGRFTRQTLRKLKAFQRRYHLTVDGVAGPTSIGKLRRLLRSSLHIAQTANASTATPVSDEPLSSADSGGVGFIPAPPTTATAGPVQDATLIDGLAVPAPGTPEVVDQIIAAANRIAFRPYIYGGGHGSFNAAGYDCSGSVSYALHGGGLVATPLDSSQFLRYGLPGAGNWITVYTNGPTHAYLEIAGLWFDTAAQSAGNGMDRWSTTEIAEPGYGHFVARHPAGW